jgi:hypothetical protein
MSEKKRGGAGRGQGRKPKKDGEKLVKRQVFFRPDQLEKVIGRNLSDHIRRIFDHFHDLEAQPEKKQFVEPSRKNHFWVGGDTCIFCGVKKVGKQFFDKNETLLPSKPDCTKALTKF